MGNYKIDYEQEWENIISFESLYKAHRRARLCKRHKKEVIEFEANLSENLWELHYDLKYNKYILGEYYKFMIYDPKEREIQAISYRDRVVQHSICDNYLMPLLNKHLIYDNTACRKNKGTLFAIKRLKHFMRQYYKRNGNTGWFVKIDVSKYFFNINHDVLKEKLARIVKNKKILRLMFQIIDSYNFDEGIGIPMGNQTSQAFALLYLNDLDRFFKEKYRIKFYARYMDDIIIMVNTKDMANKCLKAANQKLNEMLVGLNPKSQKYSIKNGVAFLGWEFKILNSSKIVQRLRGQSKKRIIGKLKACVKRRKKEKIKQALASYKGFLQYGMAHKLWARLNTMVAI